MLDYIQIKVKPLPICFQLCKEIETTLRVIRVMSFLVKCQAVQHLLELYQNHDFICLSQNTLFKLYFSLVYPDQCIAAMSYGAGCTYQTNLCSPETNNTNYYKITIQCSHTTYIL